MKVPMKRIRGLDLMRTVGDALRGGNCIIRTQTPAAAHAAIARLVRGWKVCGKRDRQTWTLGGHLPGVEGTISVEEAP